MPARALESLVSQLRQLATSPPQGDEDGQLLRRFARERDEAAFAALVTRHGPLVYGVCRRMLGHEQDAEDAFQAAFMVLARQAGQIRRAHRLAGWLHGVAVRIAMKARVAAARRQRRERNAAKRDIVEQPATGGELAEALDGEIARLPERYRQAFLLCHVEGLTNEAAARALGCPTGTILSRLSRGRERLRRGLRRRGFAPATVGAFLSADMTPATVTPAATTAAVQAALAFAGRGIRSSAAQLAAEEISTMFVAKCKAVAGMAAAGITALGVAAGARAIWVEGQPAHPQRALAAATPETSATVPKGGESQKRLADIQRELVDAAKDVADVRVREYFAGQVILESVFEWADHLVDAKLAASTTQAERIAALEDHLDRMKSLESENKQRFQAGRVSRFDLLACTFHRLKAEARLAKEKGNASGP